MNDEEKVEYWCYDCGQLLCVKCYIAHANSCYTDGFLISSLLPDHIDKIKAEGRDFERCEDPYHDKEHGK